MDEWNFMAKILNKKIWECLLAWRFVDGAVCMRVYLAVYFSIVVFIFEEVIVIGVRPIEDGDASDMFIVWQHFL